MGSSSGIKGGVRRDYQRTEIMGFLRNLGLSSPSCRLYGLEAGHSTALGPSAFLEKSSDIRLNWIFRIVKEIILTGRDLRI